MMAHILLVAIAGITFSLVTVNSIKLDPILLACPVKGQIFQQCPPCLATCSNPLPICTEECVPSCACPPGKVIDTINNECVNPQQCPLDCTGVLCVSPNCGPGQRIVVPEGQCCPDCVAIDPCDTHQCPVGTRCRVHGPLTGEVYCQASCDFDNGGCPADQECSLVHAPCLRAPCSPQVKCAPHTSCPIEGQVYQECAPCLATCSRPLPICPSGGGSGICTPGCGCPPGQVVDTINNKCVSFSQCPLNCALVSITCVHLNCADGAEAVVPPGQCCPVCACRVGNKLYHPGETFKQDCNECTCVKTGQVLCGTNDCHGPH